MQQKPKRRNKKRVRQARVGGDDGLLHRSLGAVRKQMLATIGGAQPPGDHVTTSVPDPPFTEARSWYLRALRSRHGGLASRHPGRIAILYFFVGCRLVRHPQAILVTHRASHGCHRPLLLNLQHSLFLCLSPAKKHLYAISMRWSQQSPLSTVP